MSDYDYEPTPDGMPLKRATTLRLIFVSDEAKNKFLEMLTDGYLPNVEIGASDIEPMEEVQDISVIIHEDISPSVKRNDFICPYFFRDTDGVHIVVIDRCGHPNRSVWK